MNIPKMTYEANSIISSFLYLSLSILKCFIANILHCLQSNICLMYVSQSPHSFSMFDSFCVTGVTGVTDVTGDSTNRVWDIVGV